MNIRKIVLSTILLVGGLAYAQTNGKVGINIETPSNTLDINGDTRVRNLTPTVDVESIEPIGADKNGVLTRIPTQSFVEAGNIFATLPKDILVNGVAGTQYRPELGVEHTVVVPKGKKYGVVLQVSVPIGITPESALGLGNVEVEAKDGSNLIFPRRISGYYGININKKIDTGSYTEMVGASRKVAMPDRSDIGVYPMTTIQTQYYDIIDNSQGTENKTVSYRLNGYVEKGYGATHNGVNNVNKLVVDSFTVRFNMFDSGDNPNYNWGRSSLSHQIYRLQ